MSDNKLIHTSHITIHKDKGPVRRAYIEGFETPTIFGVHTNIKDFYGIEPEKEYPATLDIYYRWYRRLTNWNLWARTGCAWYSISTRPVKGKSRRGYK